MITADTKELVHLPEEGSISVEVQIPELLHGLIGRYLDYNPSQDFNTLVSQAIARYLVQEQGR